ncbi:MAG: hypothetical protein ACTSUO_08385, partial [Candidatus Thorarchaeota archaeon]
ILCLKDPWAYFGKTGGGKMAVVFFNLTRSLSHSKGYNLLQSHLLQSPWFRERGAVVGSDVNPRIEFPIFEFVHASPYSKGYATIGHDVILALMDEVDDPSESEKQKMRILKAYESTVNRFTSRFVFDGESLGRFILVASKQEELSFLNTFIVKMKNDPSVFILDIPIWDARPSTDYSGKKFPVMVGDIYTPSEVLAYEENGEIRYEKKDVDEAIREGFEVIWVPVEYFTRFQRDTLGSLRDLAGISVSYLRKSKLFPSEKLLVDCYDSSKKDPVKKMVVTVGLEDDVNLIHYLDLSAIRVPKNIPRYIHVDIAYSGDGDALGLAMSCVKGWVKGTEQREEGTFKVVKHPVVETDFVMRIQGRPGDKIPLNKVRKLIIDLKKVYGFNIVLVTFDLGLLSEDSRQILTRIGINCDYLSLDRNPEIYRQFASLVEEKRWVCHRNEYLHFELVNLEDDTDRNKIDHPEEVVEVEFLEDGNTREIVLKGSKDSADAVAGSVYNAIKNCQTPPDVEVMKEVIDKSITKPLPPSGISEFWWVSKRSFKREKPTESEQKNQSITFKDIFKKAQR